MLWGSPLSERCPARIQVVYACSGEVLCQKDFIGCPARIQAVHACSGDDLHKETFLVGLTCLRGSFLAGIASDVFAEKWLIHCVGNRSCAVRVDRGTQKNRGLLDSQNILDFNV